MEKVYHKSMYGNTGYKTKAAYDRARYERLKEARNALKPPDAITTLTGEERAYIAGLIDGEGCLFVGAVGPQRDKTVYPIVCVVMTFKPVIQWLTERLQAGTVKNHGAKAKILLGYKAQYRFGVSGKRAKLLCETLLPYMKVKREQARLITTFPVDARIAPGVKIRRSKINAVRYRLRDKINALNH